MNSKTRSQSRPLPIRWSDKAKADMNAIGGFIARDSSVAALKWVEELIVAVEQAADMPFSGRMVPEYQRTDLREIIRGNYRIVYRASDDGIDVLTVFEGHRRFPKISVVPQSGSQK